MFKYWVFMLAVLGIALVYAYFSDPCSRLVRGDFSEKHPAYEVVSVDAESGSPESVRCVVSYRNLDSRQLREEVWWYRNAGSGWALFEILETPENPEPATGA